MENFPYLTFKNKKKKKIETSQKEKYKNTGDHNFREYASKYIEKEKISCKKSLAQEKKIKFIKKI